MIPSFNKIAPGSSLNWKRPCLWLGGSRSSPTVKSNSVPRVRKEARVPMLCGFIIFTGSLSAVAQQPVPYDGPANMEVPGVLQASGMCSADLDKNGRIDLLLLSGARARVTVLLNGADGLTVAGEFDAGASATNCATGDFNSDGEIDLALSHHDTDEIWLFFGKGAGALGAATKVRVPVNKPHAHMLVVDDVNADRLADLILAQADDNKVWVLLGDGKGGFAPSPGSPMATGNHPYVVAVADLNGDGHLDLATPNWYGKSISTFLGDGKGRFKEPPTSPIGGFSAPVAIAAGDLTGDGKIDLSLGNDDSSFVQILVGDGAGGFAPGAVPRLRAEGDCFAPVIADLTGDGRPDVIATAVNGAPTFSYWVNLGDGKFTAGHALPCPPVASRILVADLNNDRAPDLFVGTWNAAKSYIWFGKKSQR